MNKHRIIFAIMIIVDSILFQTNYVSGQEAKRMVVTGTRATIIPPIGYTYNRMQNVFINQKLDTQMGFNETAYLPEKMLMTYVVRMQINDFKLVSQKHDVQVGALKGNKYYIERLY
jgi:hypothetical protein